MKKIYNYLLNDKSKEFFTSEINKIVKDKEQLERCKREIDILYNKSNLFVIEFLYHYKQANKESSFHFRGTANNLLLLYVLGLSKVDPIKYSLPLELFNDDILNIDIIGEPACILVEYFESFPASIRVFKGSFKEEKESVINEILDNHYILIPSHIKPSITLKYNGFNYETIEDYHNYKNEYVIVRIDEKEPIHEKHVDIKNALHNNFEKEIANLIKPNTIEEYAKVIALGHGTDVWLHNQDKLFRNGKIDINSLIATREDIFDYLVKHNISANTSLDIIKNLPKAKENNQLWKEYVEVMRKNNCDEVFIDIISKVLYISFRGQAISECLYALDSDNYY